MGFAGSDDSTDTLQRIQCFITVYTKVFPEGLSTEIVRFGHNRVMVVMVVALIVCVQHRWKYLTYRACSITYSNGEHAVLSAGSLCPNQCSPSFTKQVLVCGFGEKDTVKKKGEVLLWRWRKKKNLHECPGFDPRWRMWTCLDPVHSAVEK